MIWEATVKEVASGTIQSTSGFLVDNLLTFIGTIQPMSCSSSQEVQHYALHTGVIGILCSINAIKTSKVVAPVVRNMTACCHIMQEQKHSMPCDGLGAPARLILCS